MRNDLKKGYPVRVYQKPLTREEFEGVAKLVKCVTPSYNERHEWWMVRFDDGALVQRQVHGDDMIWGFEIRVTFRYPHGETKDFHKSGKYNDVVRWAMLKPHAMHVEKLAEITRADWIRGFGDGRLRM